jgi:hypothetical protein
LGGRNKLSRGFNVVLVEERRGVFHDDGRRIFRSGESTMMYAATKIRIYSIIERRDGMVFVTMNVQCVTVEGSICYEAANSFFLAGSSTLGPCGKVVPKSECNCIMELHVELDFFYLLKSPNYLYKSNSSSFPEQKYCNLVATT